MPGEEEAGDRRAVPEEQGAEDAVQKPMPAQVAGRRPERIHHEEPRADQANADHVELPRGRGGHRKLGTHATRKEDGREAAGDAVEDPHEPAWSEREFAHEHAMRVVAWAQPSLDSEDR